MDKEDVVYTHTHTHTYMKDKIGLRRRKGVLWDYIISYVKLLKTVKNYRI